MINEIKWSLAVNRNIQHIFFLGYLLNTMDKLIPTELLLQMSIILFEYSDFIQISFVIFLILISFDQTALNFTFLWTVQLFRYTMRRNFVSILQCLIFKKLSLQYFTEPLLTSVKRSWLLTCHLTFVSMNLWFLFLHSFIA